MNLFNKSSMRDISPHPAGDVLSPPIQSRDAEIIQLTEIVRSQEIKIQALIQEVTNLRRMRYGAKSEAMSAEQRQLFEDDIVQDVAAVEAELIVVFDYLSICSGQHARDFLHG